MASNPTTLAPEELRRYARHLSLPEVGREGQERLKAARVLCVGAGGLGSPLLLYLGAAGVGTLGIVDFDVVDESNLQRQVVHGTPDVGRRKIDSAADRLRAVNPHVAVRGHAERLTRDNAMGLIAGYDLVVDGTDNFATRYLVNDACVLSGKPNVYGSVFRFEGQASVFGAPGGPCYRCLYPQPPEPGLVPSCAEGGVLGILPGLVGLIQATEALKLLLGKGEPLVGRLLLVDALEMRFREVKVRRDPACPVCGERPTVRGLIDYDEFCGVRGEAGPRREEGTMAAEMTVEELSRRRQAGDEPPLLDVREPHELAICSLGGMHIPMAQVPGRLGELDPAKELVVYCRSGARSGQVVAFLRQRGFARAVNLAGGVLAWADRIDRTMAKY